MISEFIKKHGIVLNETSLNGRFVELYSLLIKNPSEAHEKLNEYIEEKNKILLDALDTEKLVSELYRNLLIWRLSKFPG